MKIILKSWPGAPREYEIYFPNDSQVPIENGCLYRFKGTKSFVFTAMKTNAIPDAINVNVAYLHPSMFASLGIQPESPVKLGKLVSSFKISKFVVLFESDLPRELVSDTFFRKNGTRATYNDLINEIALPTKLPFSKVYLEREVALLGLKIHFRITIIPTRIRTPLDSKKIGLLPTEGYSKSFYRVSFPYQKFDCSVIFDFYKLIGNSNPEVYYSPEIQPIVDGLKKRTDSINFILRDPLGSRPGGVHELVPSDEFFKRTIGWVPARKTLGQFINIIDTIFA